VDEPITDRDARRGILNAELYLGDPHPTYTWLRRHSPVHRDDTGVWILSKYADVVHASRHPEIFCSGKGVRPNRGALMLSIVTMDEPRHGQLRRLVNRGFTPRMVGLLEPRIRQAVKESIDAVAPRGECDFVRDLAVDLPLMMIAEMLGIRREDREKFHEWSDTMIAAGSDDPSPEVMTRATDAFSEFAHYLLAVFEDRRRQPRDDLVSVLLHAQEEGILATDEEMSNDELLMFMTLLLVAGNETTRNALTGGMIALMERPEERAKLLARPGLIPTAVEEIVRWVSPVINFTRTATRDTEIRGRRIRAGEQVLLLYPSANRDEDQFPEADRFRVDREPNEHIGFGIGNHFCLGANLARLEMRAMFEALLPRLPDMQMAPGGEPVYAASTFVRGITHLPVVFTPQPV
jgi:cytochrome P450 family 142 subfamily A polypeptide 1